MERKEGTGECGKCVMGGVKGESASSGTPGIWPPEPTSVNSLFPEAGLYWGSSGLAPPHPPRSFLFWRGWRAGRGPGPALCVVGGVGGGSKNFRLLSDADPVRQAQWGCTLITYLIREEFKLCVLERGGVGGPRSHPWRPPVWILADYGEVPTGIFFSLYLFKGKDGLKLTSNPRVIE